MENFWIGFLVAMVIMLLIVLVIGGVSICKLFKRVKELEQNNNTVDQCFMDKDRNIDERESAIYETINNVVNETQKDIGLNIQECIKNVTALVDSRFDKLESKYKNN